MDIALLARSLACLTVLAIAVLGLTACGKMNFTSGFMVDGNGPVKSESRSLDDFQAVAVTGSLDVKWEPGDKATAVVKAQENLLPHLKTEVVDGRVKVYCDCSYNSDQPVTIKLTGKALDRVSLAGSGTCAATGVSGPNFRATLAGSGDVDVAGAVDDFSGAVVGSGSVRATDLKAKAVKAAVTGSGDISVGAPDELNASVTGSGSVTYRGHPSVTQRVVGSGSVAAE